MNRQFTIILDSCRYDSFIKAKTPNFDKLGKTMKVYSPAGWTLPSIISYNNGVPPLNVPLNLRKNFWDFKNGGKSKFKYNIFLTANPIILRNKFMFKNWDFIGDTKYDYNFSCNEILKDSIRFIEGESEFLAWNLVMETHSPYSTRHGVYDYRTIKTRDEFLKIQSESVELVDEAFGKIMDRIPTGTRIIITADHGELYDQNENGEWYYHHNFTYNHIGFHRKLFEIPLIYGYKK